MTLPAPYYSDERAGITIRRAIGIEREEKWCAAAIERLRQEMLL
ncbi:MAG: hypothetical protein V2A73_00445 [Pseudomonadota bacterium]